MQNEKPVSTDLASHFKLSKEIEYMSKVPYSSVVGIFMYVMVCTRPYIAHAVGVVNLSEEH